ncbi:shikimate dehydrogenase [Phytomonospora sp. NPDC050363]|uniref:shikimate dehydrogenase n=1 Tax=Phytomonospora sp. NPDC050363 TaxID=3155642 RepID=UPI0033D83E48
MSAEQGRYVVGLVGAGIGSSLSPALHEHEARHLGLRYIYQLIDITDLGLGADDVGSLVASAHHLGFRGLNITHPCKQLVVGHLDELSDDAAAIGAVNTVVFTGGRSIGHNTDGLGFSASFHRNMPGAAIEDVVILGVGGAGAAVAQAMLRAGAGRLTLIDADLTRAERVATALTAEAGAGREPVRARPLDELPDRLLTADGLVNATPIGMTPHHGTPVRPELLRPDLWVADVVYRPIETELLRDARRRGCRTMHGGGMVAYQAAEAMRLFTGRAPDPERMYRHLAAAIGERPPGGVDA